MNRMHKFWLTFDKDEEQIWLNDLCAQGWALEHYAMGLYTFVPCEPGEFLYQIDLLPGHGFRADGFDGYREFMEDTGVEVVARWFRWVFLRKRAEDGPFEIYTDAASQIQMYERIRRMFVFVLCLELACFCYFIAALVRISSFDLFFRCTGAVLILIIAAILRTIVRCTRRIRELRERQ